MKKKTAKALLKRLLKKLRVKVNVPKSIVVTQEK